MGGRRTAGAGIVRRGSPWFYKRAELARRVAIVSESIDAILRRSFTAVVRNTSGGGIAMVSDTSVEV